MKGHQDKPSKSIASPASANELAKNHKFEWNRTVGNRFRNALIKDEKQNKNMVEDHRPIRVKRCQSQSVSDAKHSLM